MRKVHEQIILMNMKKNLKIPHTWLCLRFMNIHLEVLQNESHIHTYLFAKVTKNGESFLFLY